MSGTSGFGYLDFADALLYVSLALCVADLGFIVGGLLLRDRRWVRAANVGMLLTCLTVVGASAGLVAGFVEGAYQIKYIYDYSQKDLGLGFKLAGLWAGLDGSILFWSMLLGIVSAVVAVQFRRERERHPVGRRLEPYVYLVLTLVQLFFLVVIGFVANPFTTLHQDFIAQGHGNLFFQNFPGGVVPDGSGLNPLLVNYWMTIHPPSIYIAFVTYTVPFAFGVAALIANEQGNYWIRKTRRWMLVGWLFNTNGIIMGGLWAYEVLGWGGYWAWDPVENASLIPWFASTALLHSIMVQERRGMLRAWNAFLVFLTFFLSIFATYLTRSGIVSSVHAFASGPVGWWFFGLLMAVLLGGLFIVAFRARDLRSSQRFESFLSRESIFLLNNLVLIAIAAGVVFLTILPKISSWLATLFPRSVDVITVSVHAYNLVAVPLFVLLLVLTALGPGMGWITTSPRNLRRNFYGAAVVALPIAVGIQLVAIWVRGGDGGPFAWWKQIYPTGLVNYSAAFILTALAYEVWRTARSRAQRRGCSFLQAFLTMGVKNNRRYGGYLVHVGLALLAIAVVNSSMFRSEKDVDLAPGQSFRTGEYEVKLDRVVTDENHPVYALQQAMLTVTKDGEKVATMAPERRAYRKKGQTTSEPEIVRLPLQDLYCFYKGSQGGEAQGQQICTFNFYRTPLMNLLFIGWITMLLGGLWAALPMGRRRVGLAD